MEQLESSPTLTSTEVRVLACLVEKEITTPDYYPLTLRALTSACNQKSNRHPVVAYDEKTVVRALDGLRSKKLAWIRTYAGSRTPKYEHSFREALGLSPNETAVLCQLMLRGPQTLGETRAGSARLCDGGAEVPEVEGTIQALSERQPAALVVRLPKQSGQKEIRIAHLLAGEPDLPPPSEPTPALEAATLEVRAENERITRLEEEVESLRQTLAELRQSFADFRREFE